MKVGDGSEPGVFMGPLIDMSAVDKIEELVGDAVKKGAIVQAGGSRCRARLTRGQLLRSDGDDRRSAPRTPARRGNIWTVAALYSFETEEEVIKQANDVPFGLSAYLFTENMDRAIRVGEQPRRAWSASTRSALARPRHRSAV
jgi:succinate-semialdehyde dehydrogenase/glutarate-semialdehyde dehydrogenase